MAHCAPQQSLNVSSAGPLRHLNYGTAVSSVQGASGPSSRAQLAAAAGPPFLCLCHLFRAHCDPARRARSLKGQALLSSGEWPLHARACRRAARAALPQHAAECGTISWDQDCVAGVPLVPPGVSHSTTIRLGSAPAVVLHAALAPHPAATEPLTSPEIDHRSGAATTRQQQQQQLEPSQQLPAYGGGDVPRSPPCTAANGTSLREAAPHGSVKSGAAPAHPPEAAEGPRPAVCPADAAGAGRPLLNGGARPAAIAEEPTAAPTAGIAGEGGRQQQQGGALAPPALVPASTPAASLRAPVESGPFAGPSAGPSEWRDLGWRHLKPKPKRGVNGSTGLDIEPRGGGEASGGGGGGSNVPGGGPLKPALNHGSGSRAGQAGGEKALAALLSQPRRPHGTPAAIAPEQRGSVRRRRQLRQQQQLAGRLPQLQPAAAGIAAPMERGAASAAAGPLVQAVAGARPGGSTSPRTAAAPRTAAEPSGPRRRGTPGQAADAADADADEGHDAHGPTSTQRQLFGKGSAEPHLNGGRSDAQQQQRPPGAQRPPTASQQQQERQELATASVGRRRVRGGNSEERSEAAAGPLTVPAGPAAAVAIAAAAAAPAWVQPVSGLQFPPPQSQSEGRETGPEPAGGGGGHALRGCLRSGSDAEDDTAGSADGSDEPSTSYDSHVSPLGPPPPGWRRRRLVRLFPVPRPHRRKRRALARAAAAAAGAAVGSATPSGGGGGAGSGERRGRERFSFPFTVSRTSDIPIGLIGQMSLGPTPSTSPSLPNNRRSPQQPQPQLVELDSWAAGPAAGLQDKRPSAAAAAATAAAGRRVSAPSGLHGPGLGTGAGLGVGALSGAGAEAGCGSAPSVTSPHQDAPGSLTAAMMAVAKPVPSTGAAAAAARIEPPPAPSPSPQQQYPPQLLWEKAQQQEQQDPAAAPQSAGRGCYSLLAAPPFVLFAEAVSEHRIVVYRHRPAGRWAWQPLLPVTPAACLGRDLLAVALPASPPAPAHAPAAAPDAPTLPNASKVLPPSSCGGARPHGQQPDGGAPAAAALPHATAAAAAVGPIGTGAAAVPSTADANAVSSLEFYLVARPPEGIPLADDGWCGGDPPGVDGPGEPPPPPPPASLVLPARSGSGGGSRAVPASGTKPVDGSAAAGTADAAAAAAAAPVPSLELTHPGHYLIITPATTPRPPSPPRNAFSSSGGRGRSESGGASGHDGAGSSNSSNGARPPSSSSRVALATATRAAAAASTFRGAGGGVSGAACGTAAEEAGAAAPSTAAAAAASTEVATTTPAGIQPPVLTPLTPLCPPPPAATAAAVGAPQQQQRQLQSLAAAAAVRTGGSPTAPQPQRQPTADCGAAARPGGGGGGGGGGGPSAPSAQRVLRQDVALVVDASSLMGWRGREWEESALELRRLWEASQRVRPGLLVLATSREMRSLELEWRDKQAVLPQPDVMLLGLGTQVAYRVPAAAPPAPPGPPPPSPSPSARDTSLPRGSAPSPAGWDCGWGWEGSRWQLDEQWLELLDRSYDAAAVRRAVDDIVRQYRGVRIAPPPPPPPSSPASRGTAASRAPKLPPAPAAAAAPAAPAAGTPPAHASRPSAPHAAPALPLSSPPQQPQLHGCTASSGRPALSYGLAKVQSRHKICLEVHCSLVDQIVRQIQERLATAAEPPAGPAADPGSGAAGATVRFEVQPRGPRGEWCSLYVLPAAAGKAAALRHVMRRFDIDPSAVVAVGDTDRDAELMAAAGAAVVTATRPQPTLRALAPAAAATPAAAVPAAPMVPDVQADEAAFEMVGGCSACNGGGVSCGGGGAGSSAVVVAAGRRGPLGVMEGLRLLGLL